MSKGSRSRTICIRLLMFALAFQAMTPDAHDLSSPALFKLLASPVDGNLAAGQEGDAPAPHDGDSLPSDPNDRDELPDNVCLPGACLARLSVHRGPDGSNRPASVLFGLSEPLSRCRDRDVISYQATRIAGTNLGLSLVRLTC